MTGNSELASVLDRVDFLIRLLKTLEDDWRRAIKPKEVDIEYQQRRQEVLETQRQLHAVMEESEAAEAAYCELLVASPLLHLRSIEKTELEEWAISSLNSTYGEAVAEIGAVARIVLGFVERDRGDLPKSLSHYSEAQRIYIEAHKSVEAAACQANVGVIHAKQGFFELAKTELDDAYAVLADAGDERTMLKLLGCRTFVELRLRNYVAAKKAAKEQLQRAKNVNDDEEQSHALGQLGTCHRQLSQCASRLGMFLDAQEYLEQAAHYYHSQRDLAREYGEVAGQRNAIGNLGNVLSDLGRYDEAIDCFEDSTKLSEILEDAAAIAVDECNHGKALMSLGRPAEAKPLLERSLAFFREQGDAPRAASVVWNLALVSEAQGDISEAASYAEAALHLRSGVDDRKREEIQQALHEWQDQVMGEAKWHNH